MIRGNQFYNTIKLAKKLEANSLGFIPYIVFMFLERTAAVAGGQGAADQVLEAAGVPTASHGHRV